MSGLGRKVPGDWKHVERNRFRVAAPSEPVEKTLSLPWWHNRHDQGNEGACVGFGSSMMMAILNSTQRRVDMPRGYTVRYDPWWLWDEAKRIDEWPDTNPGDDNGTSVRAAMDVARDQGLVRIDRDGKKRWGYDPDPNAGVAANRWAMSVDEMRAAIDDGNPVTIGVNWYTNFDNPEKVGNDWFIGRDEKAFGSVRGGHCVCVYGASDRRNAFKVKNSWGRSYPLVWIPYPSMQRLLDEYGEATLVTDR